MSRDEGQPLQQLPQQVLLQHQLERLDGLLSDQRPFQQTDRASEWQRERCDYLTQSTAPHKNEVALNVFWLRLKSEIIHATIPDCNSIAL